MRRNVVFLLRRKLAILSRLDREKSTGVAEYLKLSLPRASPILHRRLSTSWCHSTTYPIFPRSRAEPLSDNLFHFSPSVLTALKQVFSLFTLHVHVRYSKASPRLIGDDGCHFKCLPILKQGILPTEIGHEKACSAGETGTAYLSYFNLSLILLDSTGSRKLLCHHFAPTPDETGDELNSAPRFMPFLNSHFSELHDEANQDETKGEIQCRTGVDPCRFSAVTSSTLARANDAP